MPSVLESLRPHVDRLHVWLNGYNAVPECVHEFADEHVLCRDNLGAEKKTHWAAEWDGIYLSVDDDIVYPVEYVPRMVAAVESRGGEELVACHGRIYWPDATQIYHVRNIGHYHLRIDCSQNVNHGGTGVMAWDARALKVPTEWPQQNLADMQMAVWAQRQRVPIWLLAHQAHWFEPLALVDPNGIFASSKRERHERRNTLLRDNRPWRVWVREDGKVIDAS